jgi:hypothetical protein
MERLRWTVIVRDGGRCDLLGDGSTSQRLTSTPPVSRRPRLRPSRRPTIGIFAGRGTAAVILAPVLGAILVAAIVLRRRR